MKRRRSRIGVLLALAPLLACAGSITVTTNVARIELDATATTITTDDTVEITATAFNADGDELAGGNFDWSVNRGSFRILRDDRIEYQSAVAGQAQVSAQIADQIGSITITVTEAQPAS